jgi:hypothetical protein
MRTRRTLVAAGIKTLPHKCYCNVGGADPNLNSKYYPGPGKLNAELSQQNGCVHGTQQT